MTDNARFPEPPAGAGAAGAKLWNAVLSAYELEEHELALLRQAVRTADLCDELAAVVAEDGPMRVTRLGERTVHPAVVELRQQRIVLARLVVALRVPLGEADDRAPARPQYRGLRGVHGGVHGGGMAS